MTRLDVDVAIAGSGFAGSILAAILQRHGLRVALLDRARHPRFAIGESSTPTANLILRDLADRYGLDWLRPLAQYGTWRQTYPHVTRGIKRGFSYFWHEPDRQFASRPDHANELLVAASSCDEVSDTQWLRSDVDAFLFAQARGEGVMAFEATEIETLTALSPGWMLDCRTPDGPVDIRCRFLIDGTGSGGLLSQRLDIADESHLLRTNSRAIFGHVAGLLRWSELLSAKAAAATSDHPFDCDHSALHHLIPGGWMWWLRFDNDITSVGLVLDGTASQADNLSADAEFAAAISRLPAFNQIPALRFAAAACATGSASARTATHTGGASSTQAGEASGTQASGQTKGSLYGGLVAPGNGLVRTGRLQRLASQMAGDDWALLPHTAGFIDPLHSSGIAHSLSGVERLAGILLAHLSHGEQTTDSASALATGLQRYAATVRSELLLIDALVSGCYSALRQRSFRKFVAWSMLYFAAATTWERRRLAGFSEPAALFLADDDAFRAVVASLQPELETLSDAAFEQLCEDQLAPFNHVGLFHPPVPNMYARTAVPDTE